MALSYAALSPGNLRSMYSLMGTRLESIFPAMVDAERRSVCLWAAQAATQQPSSAHTQRSPFRPPLRRTNVRARRADAQDRLYAPPVEGCGGKERRARVRQGVKRVASGQRARAHCTSGAFQTAAHQVTNRGPRVEGPTSSHERLCPLLRQHDDLPRVWHELEAHSRQEDDEAHVAFVAVVPSSPNVRPGAPCAAACAPHSYTQPAHPTLAMC